MVHTRQEKSDARINDMVVLLGLVDPGAASYNLLYPTWYVRSRKACSTLARSMDGWGLQTRRHYRHSRRGPSAHPTRGRFAWCFPCFWYFHVFGFTPDAAVSLVFPGRFHLYGAIEVNDGSITDWLQLRRQYSSHKLRRILRVDRDPPTYCTNHSILPFSV